mmetsp:Transcript_1569/g.9668  ORF Transcript_1569/g.9668 Transcript_1569/m.9668 type:complete len:98 (-) Transcript_1569:205-498(-)
MTSVVEITRVNATWTEEMRSRAGRATWRLDVQIHVIHDTVFIATSFDERHVSSFLLVNQTAKTGMPKPKPSTAAMPSPNLSLRFVIFSSSYMRSACS